MFELGYISHKRYQKTTRTVWILLSLSMVIFLVLRSISLGGQKFLEGLIEVDSNIKSLDVSYGYFQDMQYKRRDLTKASIDQIARISEVEGIYTQYELIGPTSELKYGTKTIHMGNRIYMSYHQYEIFERQNLKRYELINPLVAGDTLSNSGVMISELVLLYWGITDYESMIGEMVTIEVSGYVTQVKVDGIYNAYLGDDFFDESLRQTLLDNGGMNEQQLLTPIIISEAVYQLLESNTSYVGTQRKITVIAKSIHDVLAIQESIEAFLPNEISSELTLIFGLIERSKQLDQVLIVFIGIALIQSMLMLLSGIVTKIGNQKSFLQMLTTMGYQRKHMFWIYLIDYSILLIKTIVLSTILALVITFGIDQTLRDMYLNNTNLTNRIFLLNINSYLNYVLFYVVIFYVLVTLVVWTFINKDQFGDKDVF